SQRIVVVRPADRRIATVQASTALRRDDADGGGCASPVLMAAVDRVTVERTTAAPTGESSIQTDSTRPAALLPHRDGLTYLAAPNTGTELRFFDPVTRRSVPLVPLGTDTVDGLDVTRMRAEIPDTDLAALPGADPHSRITKPGAWFGWPGANVTADSHQRGSYTLWIDQKSGLIVDAEIAVTREYRAGDRRLTEFDATLRYDAKTRKTLVAAARAQARPIWLARRVVPLVAGLLAIAAIAGLLLHRRREPRGTEQGVAGDRP
ncbi:porin PorA family protein, partial [Gordonia crocea]